VPLLVFPIRRENLKEYCSHYLYMCRIMYSLDVLRRRLWRMTWPYNKKAAAVGSPVDRQVWSQLMYLHHQECWKMVRHFQTTGQRVSRATPGSPSRMLEDGSSFPNYGSEGVQSNTRMMAGLLRYWCGSHVRST
jgi:hypothetical protein